MKKTSTVAIVVCVVAVGLVASGVLRQHTSKPRASELIGHYVVDAESSYFDKDANNDVRVKASSIDLKPGGLATLNDVPEMEGKLLARNVGPKKARWNLVKSGEKWVIRLESGTSAQATGYDFDLLHDSQGYYLGIPVGDPDSYRGLFYRKVK